MQLSSGFQIPDGLLADIALGNENSRLGVPRKNPALHPGIDASNFTIALGLQTVTTTTRIGSRCTGKERDAESGNDYFGARYYASTMGRWMSPDADFTLKRILPNPQRWNRYAYVHNNPLAFFDPDGLQDFSVFLGYGPKDAPILTGKNRLPNWGQIKADAIKHGNTVTVYQGNDDKTGATVANFQKALASGQTTVVIGHDTFLDSGSGMKPFGTDLSNGIVGRTTGDPLTDALTTSVSANGGTVGIFGCSSIDLAGIYSGANTFVGVDSGADLVVSGLNGITTSIDGLLAAGSTFVDQLASGASLGDAVTAANGVIRQDTTGMDDKDKVVAVQKPNQ